MYKPNNDVAIRIIRIMEEKRLQLSEISGRSKFTIAKISQVIKGKSNLTNANKYDFIENGLGVSLERFYSTLSDEERKRLFAMTELDFRKHKWENKEKQNS